MNVRAGEEITGWRAYNMVEERVVGYSRLCTERHDFIHLLACEMGWNTASSRNDGVTVDLNTNKSLANNLDVELQRYVEFVVLTGLS